jgi:hypothetical protein
LLEGLIPLAVPVAAEDVVGGAGGRLCAHRFWFS